MKRSLQFGAMLLAAATFAFAGYGIYNWKQDAGAGDRLMAATITGLNGQPQPLAQWRGKVLVVNFWATWCAPCREEIPLLVQYRQRYEAHGVEVLGIAADAPQRVAPYARDIGINYPLFVGGVEVIDFARQLGNDAGVLPFTVVVDRQGRITERKVGALKPENLEAWLAPLL